MQRLLAQKLPLAGSLPKFTCLGLLKQEYFSIGNGHGSQY